MGAAVKFCPSRKRNSMRCMYLLVGIWTFLLCVGFLYVDIKQGRREKIRLPSPSINMFDKWYILSNQRKRNLLGNEEGSQYNSIKSLDKPSSKQNVLTDISVYYTPSDTRSLEKVLSILESFAFRNDQKIPDLDCVRILEGDKESILRGKLGSLQLRSTSFEQQREILQPSDKTLTDLTKDCENFRTVRKYVPMPLSKEEAAFPIAYIITIHRDVPSFERLLRTIYHPQNLYCVHVDLKSDEKFKDSVEKISKCFENVFIASNLTSVRYTHYSRVQADMNCMKDLLQMSKLYPWRYVINLCGQDFPLKTNLEIVRSLKSLNGFNNLETVTTPAHKRKRFELHFDLPSESKNDHSTMVKTGIKKDPPPNNVEIFAGSAYYIFKRQAIEYILTDSFMQKFFLWCEDTYSPDELMWATIQRMFPQVPGSTPPHDKYDLNELQSITRIVKWGGLDKKVYPKCEGRFVRGICVYGCGDLAWLVNQKHLFANKFDPTIDFTAIYCLENFLRNKTIQQSNTYLTQGYL